MGWPKFGRTKKKDTSFSFQELLDEVAQRSNPHYAAWYLRGPAGEDAAIKLAGDLYDKYARPGIALEAIAAQFNQLLERDNRKYRNNIQVINRFSTRASQSRYSTGLARKGNRAGGLTFVPGAGSSELDRATDWVTKLSTTLNGGGRDKKAWKDLRIVGLCANQARRFLCTDGL